MSSLKYISYNIRGLNNYIKRKKLYLWLHDKNIDITFLQETHCVSSKAKIISSSWPGKMFHGLSESSASRGVAILVHKNLRCNTLNYKQDKDGRILIVNTEIDNQIFSFVSLYAPNDEYSRSAFFKYAVRWIKEHTMNERNLYIAGDFNSCLRQCDKTTGNVEKDRSRKLFLELIKDLNLKDVYQLKNGVDSISYTYERGDLYKSRLDYVFVSGKVNIIQCENKYLISGSKKNNLSDHKAVFTECSRTSSCRGPSYWKFNVSLLQNEEYVQEMKTILVNEKTIFINMKSKILFWESLKQKIKQFSIDFSTRIKQRCKSEIEKMECQIEKIRHSELPNNSKIEEIEILQAKIDHFYSSKAEGARVRSRIKWWEQGEKSSSYFLRLESEQQMSNIIKEIEIDGLIKYDDREILEAIYNFYKNLYSADFTESKQINEYLQKVNINQTISEDEKIILESNINEKEFDLVVSNLKTNRSPGIDGICQEFYKYFWPQLKMYYIEMTNEIFETGKMCHTMRKAIISLIFKKENKKNLNNYRPISITNTDYKILAFVLANRLQTVLQHIISPEQTAYVKGRYIGMNCRYIIDIIDYCNKYNTAGLICFLDYTKAFDSLNHKFLISCLKKFNFGPIFIKWIEILYDEPILVTKNNGWLTRPIQMRKGIRQGCPVSGMLFVIATEILATQIKQNHTLIKSIPLKDGYYCTPFLQYADDATLPLDGYQSLNNALSVINEFGDFSGLRLNMDKTEAIILGPLVNVEKPDDLNIKINNYYVKYFGIHVGSNLDMCYKLHWEKKSKV